MAVTLNAKGTSVSSFTIGKGGQAITLNANGYLTIDDGVDTEQPIGYNTIPIYEIDANDTFDLAHAGMMWHKDSGGAVTFTCDNDSTIPQGSTWIVHNDDAEDITIAQGTGVTIAFLASGAAPVTGDVTVSQGGIVTVYKYTNTEYWVWGDDGPFNILTAGSTTDSTLRWNGSAWAENTTVTITSTGVVTAASTAGNHTFSVDSATTNADIPVVKLSASSTGTPAAGIGPSIQFEAETAAANLEIGGEIALEATDVTATTEDFDFVFNLMSAGAAATEAARITSTGSLFLPEKADADADVAGYGQIWVDLATPNNLYFTDDAGTDYLLNSGGTVTASTGADNRVAVFTSGTNIEGDASFTWDASTATLTLFDTGDADSVAFQHDGTDFNTTFGGVATTEWNITGLTNGLNINSGATGGPHILLSGSNNPYIQGNGAVVQFTNTGALQLLSSTAAGQNVNINARNATGIVNVAANSINYLQVVASDGTVRVNDSGGTDYGAFSHDGTDFKLDFNNTQDFVVTIPGAANSRTNRMVVTAAAGAAAGEPVFEVNASGTNGNSNVFIVSNPNGDLFVVDNEGDTRALGSLGVGTGFVIDNDAVAGYASFNNTGASNGFLFYTTSANDVRGAITTGTGATGVETISVNVNFDEFTIRRDIAGSATYSEAGYLIKLERDVTGTTSTNGGFMSWTDDTDANAIGMITKEGFLGLGDTPTSAERFVVSTPTVTNAFTISDTNGRVGVHTTSLGYEFNINDQLGFASDSGLISGVTTIRTNSTSTGQMTMGTQNMRVGGDVSNARLAVVGNTGSTAIVVGIKEATSGQPMILLQDTGGTSQWGLDINGHFSDGGTGSGIFRFDYLNKVTPASADGDGAGINLRTENASGTPRDVAYIDAVYDDISADQASLRFSVRPGSADADPTEVMRIEGETKEVRIVNGTDYVAFSHDGTDFNIAGTLTTDINMTSGITAVNLPEITLTTALDETYGGTGQTTLTTGDLLYASGANTFGKLALGNVGEVLTVVGSNVAWNPPAIIEFAYDSTVTAADPGAGTIRFDSVTIGSIANAYIDDLDASGDNAEWILSNLSDGDILTFRSITDSADYIIASVNGSTTDGTGYWTVPLTLIHTGTIFTNGDQMRVSVEWAGSNASVTGFISGTVADNQVVTGTGASSVDSSANLTFDGSTLTLGGTGQLLLPQENDNTTPTLAFGDGDTGFYELSDDTLRLSIGTSALYQFDATHITGTTSASFYLRNTTVTATNPSLGPRRDTNTGIGSAENDSMSLIAGGVEMMRFDSTVGGQDHIKTEVPFYMDERTAALNDYANYGQLWVRTETPNMLMFTDDAGNDFTANNVFEIAYAYSSAVTSTDPGAGTLNFNSVTIGSITTVYIDDLDDTGRDNSYMLSTLADGDLIEFRSASDPADYIVATVNGAPTDSTGYWTIGLTLVNTGTIFTNGDQLRIIPTFLSQAAGSGGTVTSVDITAGTLIDKTGGPITTSGSITIDVDLSEATEAVYAPATDYLLFLDGGVTGTAAKESGADFATAIAGTGLTASSGTLTVDDVALGTSTTGDYVATITGGVGIDSTGATTGEGIAHTLSVDLGEVTAVVFDPAVDFVPIIDGGATGTTQKDAWADIATAIAGSGITATSGVLSADNNGTVTSVDITAGTLIDKTGGPITTSGSITIDVDLSEATEAVFAPATDYVLFLDGGVTGTAAKEAWTDFATAIAGTGITATSGVLSADNNGTVTSIGITAGTLIDVTGSPVTTSGNITVDVDLSEATEAVYAPATDYVLFLDGGATGTAAKESGADFATALAGTGLAASSGTLTVDGYSTATVQTTTATQTELLAYSITSGTSVGFEALIIGREDATGDTVLEKITGLISNEAGTTALIGTPGVDRHEAAGASTWSVTVAADDTSDELTFDVTGQASHTIDWKIKLEVIEV